jgi:hypothetical protein
MAVVRLGVQNPDGHEVVGVVRALHPAGVGAVGDHEVGP